MSDYTIKDLSLMKAAEKYNNWIFNKIQPWLGDHVLEVGAGIGTFTDRLKREALNVYAIDSNPHCCDILRQKYPDVFVIQMDASSCEGMMEFKMCNIDTIVCLNVLEHIGDDDKTLKIFYDILIPTGVLILQVPALRALYGPIDRELGHKRRYSLDELRVKIKNAGFSVEDIYYMNSPAVYGWFTNKLLGRKSQSISQIKVYDKFVPFIRFTEDFSRPNIGLSIFAIGVKL